MNSIPLGLRSALESGNCVLFIGAGIGRHLSTSAGIPAPTASELAQEMAKQFSLETGEYPDLAQVSQVVELRHSRTEMESFLQDRLANLEPDEDLLWLFSRRWKAIFTTNYDNGIERAYELIEEPPQNPVTISSTAELSPWNPVFEVPIYHLHGALFGSYKPHILITEDDYARYKEQRRMLFEILKTEFATSTILYIGYSNRDPNWKSVFTEMAEEFYPSSMPSSFRVSPHTELMEREILAAKGIETLDANYKEFVSAATVSLSEVSLRDDQLAQLKKHIPLGLIALFEKSPAAVTRLLNSWEYVNQASFDETPNIRNFLRGDRPNWALVGSCQQFERDLEEEMYDELLDYATSTTSNQRAILLLGPAGYGTSTLLMTLAARLISDRAGTVFMLKPGCRVIEGDIDFASSSFPDRPFFIVDNAVANSEEVLSAIDRLRNTKRSGLFLLGARLNEWRQSYRKLRGKEYLLESLSDFEINRLLDCLEIHGELGALEPLNRDIQFSVIKQKHGKELLVSMREATEGKSFDAILEGEFRGIQDSASRRLYLTVCCLYQYGAYARDSLLSKLMNLPLVELYQRTNDATEGVVVYECINESHEIYAARARHRVIAEVVWERCGNEGQREQIIQSTLASLNLNYGVDKNAFESFVRSDRLVEGISSLEGKIKFFDKACQKDPESPYVRQHYARMLSRENLTDLALNQIDQAIKMGPHLRVLHHTRGMVLMQMALSTESLDIGRRRLVQSEASFRTAMRLYARDEYSYQGLAQLYFGWAKRAPTEEETTEYLAKAEEIINEGLKVVRVRDGLWIESSNIKKYLGDQPARIQALERAVKDSPSSIISRYLLGRAYRNTGLYQKAIDVLDPVIKNYHNEFRAFVEYANALLCLGRPYKEAIAVLKLSTLYGYSDPRFIATLGGMLFMDKSFEEADEVFFQSSKRDFTASELNTIQFRPPDPNSLQEPLRITGRVVVLKAGYAIVESPPYPSFLCPGSKFGGTLMERNLDISFEPAFTARSNIADRPEVISN